MYYSIRFEVFPKWNRWLSAHSTIGFANSACNVNQQLRSGTGPSKNPCYAVENHGSGFLWVKSQNKKTNKCVWTRVSFKDFVM